MKEQELKPSKEQETKEKSTASSTHPSSPSSSSGGGGNNKGTMWDECKLLRRLRHPNVVCVQDVVDAQLTRPLKGSGARNLRRAIVGAGGFFTMQRAQVIFWQIASGLAYCHEMKIAHRNLKPESIMVSDSEAADAVKLANFSLAIPLRSTPCKDKCGTMPFVAPEILAGKRYDASASDVWSMGVVLLEMICGINKVPRMLNWGGTNSPSGERAKDLESFFQSPGALLESVEADLGSLSEGLGELLAGLLGLAPDQRWTAERARDCLWSSRGEASSLPAGPANVEVSDVVAESSGAG